MISRRIDNIMKSQKMTQKELAALLNVSQPAVSKYLKNRVPPPQVLLNLAILGETTVEWILTGKQFYSRSGQNQVKEKVVPGYNSSKEITKSLANLPQELSEIIELLIDQLQILSNNSSAD